MPKIHFGEFLKTWSLRSNSVTRQVSFNRTKIGGKCQNGKNSNATFWVIFKQCDFWSDWPASINTEECYARDFKISRSSENHRKISCKSAENSWKLVENKEDISIIRSYIVLLKEREIETASISHTIYVSREL